MDYYTGLLRMVIAARLPQILIRYVGLGLAYLIAHTGVIIPQADQQGFINTVVAFLVLGVSVGLDWLSHRWQKQDASDRIVKSWVPSDNIVPLLIVGVLLATLTGCKFSQQLAAYSAAAATAVATHTTVSVSVDPNTGEFTANVGFKDAQGRDVVEKVSIEELKRRCEACNDHAQAELKASYKKALAEMADTQANELAKLKAARKKCPNGMCSVGATGSGSLLPVPSAQIPEPATVLTESVSTSTQQILHWTPQNTWTTSDRVLVMGDNYPGTQAALNECVRDALTSGSESQAQLAFKFAEVRLIQDQVDTAANIKACVLAWKKDYKPGDRRLICRSSHGTRDTNSAGKVVNLIVTYDMVASNRWDDSTEVSMDWWHTALADLPPGCNPLIFFDLCYAGGDIRKFASRTSRSLDGPDYVTQRVEATPETLDTHARLAQLPITFIAACGPGQVSEETSRTGGAGTYAFWKAVKLLGPSKRGCDYVVKMREILSKEGFSQRPECHGTGSAMPLFQGVASKAAAGDFRPY